LSGISFDDILIRSGIKRNVLETILAGLLSNGEIVQMTREPRIFLALEAVETLKTGLLDELTAYMSVHPLKEGIAKEELKTRLPKRSDRRFFTPLVSLLERDGLVLPDRELVKPEGQTLRTNPSTSRLEGKISEFLQENGIEPPTVREIMEHFLCDEKSVRDNLALLTRNGIAVRISADLYYESAALAGLRAKLVERLREKGEITPSEYRDLTGLSRKFLIPLLEHFDSEKVTIRVGDKRVFRKSSSG
ncbi:MAG: SelB C-terminal domain-containing protein, partial [Deltaproteobacteria bacterium]